MSDTARLVDAARAGDRESLESLYARHQGRLLAFVRSRLPAWLALRVDARDVVQDALTESSRRIASFEPRGPSSFYRWLVEIAARKISEAARAQNAKKRSLEVPLDAPLRSSDTSPSGRAVRSEVSERLHDGLAALPERQAEAVRLRYLEGLSVAETARSLACSESAVKALVSRGLMDLARSVGIFRET